MLLVIEGFPADLMAPLGVEVIPQGTTGLVRSPACPTVLVHGDDGTAGWWLCYPGEIAERPPLRGGPSLVRPRPFGHEAYAEVCRLAEEASTDS